VLFWGLDRQIAGSHSLLHDVAFANTDAGEDPVIGGVDIFSRSALVSRRGGTLSAKGADLHFGDLRPDSVGVVNESS